MINFCTSPMMYTITPSEDYNQWLKRSDTELNKQTNQNSLEVPKIVKATNTNTLL